MIAAGRSPFPTAFTNQTYDDLDDSGRLAIALDDYAASANGTDDVSNASPANTFDISPTGSPAVQALSTVQLDSSDAGPIAPSLLTNQLPAITPHRSYTAEPGDSISSILGTSDPAAIGVFARLNHLTSSGLEAGRSYDLPNLADQPSAADQHLGQSLLDADNRQRAPLTLPPSAPAKVVSLPNVALCSPPVASTPPAFPTEPPLPSGALKYRLVQNTNGQPYGPNLQSRPDPRPAKQTWLDTAQRNFWLWVSNRTADNEIDAVKGLAEEIWDDLPGLTAGIGAIPSRLGSLTEEAPLGTGPYRAMAQDLRGTGLQANHLNQNAAYGSEIPKDEGLALGMKGNAITDVGSPHYDFHSALEEFWTPFRKGLGSFVGTPTNADYGAAVEKALIRAGYPPAKAADLARQAAAERPAYGLSPSDPVPRVPGRLPQKGSR